MSVQMLTLQRQCTEESDIGCRKCDTASLSYFVRHGKVFATISVPCIMWQGVFARV